MANNHYSPDKNTVYFYLALVNIVSGTAIWPVNFGLFSVLGVLAIALFVAWAEAAVYGWLQHTFLRRLAVPILVLVAMVMNVFIIVDAFLLIQFRTVLSLQSLDLVLGTNVNEAREFLSSYAPPLAVIAGIAAVVAVNAAFWWLAKRMALILAGNRIALWTKRVAAGAGAAVLAYMVVIFAVYRHGAQVPTFSAPMRMGYAMVQRAQNTRLLDRLRTLSANTVVEPSDSPAFDIVWVLGESFSRSHSPLYGYEKPTTPCLSALAADSALVVMTDVVTHEDWTQKVLKSLFSTGRGNASFGTQPLFPVLMRKAGWKIDLYDNEFLENPGSTFFFDDPALSRMMFDKRNTAKTALDGELAETVALRDSAAMYIVHLMGQHFAYVDRYPSHYQFFTSDDYDASRFNSRQREILAHYDNATLYNDAVVGGIIDRFRARDCIVIYFPDHGEEIYDCRDYFGHGNAVTASDIGYQIQIPMFVYFSDTFRSEHPDIVGRFHAAKDLPVTTDDFSHLMLDLAGVKSPYFDPKRSFINPAYDASAPRIVLHSLDFDAIR